MATNYPKWTAKKVREIIINPIYAGIGPFPTTVDGIEIDIGGYPAIISDHEWVEGQVRMITEVGARAHLIAMRRALHQTLGVKVAILAQQNWLEDSIRAIEVIGARAFYRRLLAQLRPKQQTVHLVSNQVHLEDISPILLNQLVINPNELYRLSSETFENLICERLMKMGLEVQKVGKHTFQKDGGIDIVAWPKNVNFPFLIAVQAKHHRSPERKTGPKDVRELLGVIQSNPFNAGILVTNTTFTPDALWVAKQKNMLLRLRDFSDIKRWLADDFLNDYDWREFPERIEVCPGVFIQIPKMKP